MENRKEKFTPGPWKIHLDKRNGTACSIIEDKTGDCVARTVYRFHRGERHANGNLISAAPEMYEALGEMVETVKTLCGNNCTEILQKSIAVLKKARGER